MGRKCMLQNCGTYYDKNPELAFHSFPLKDNNKYKQWIQAIPKDLIQLPLQQNTYICSKHFSHNAYQPETPLSKSMLRKNAVPALFYTSNEDITEKNVEKKRFVNACTQMSPEKRRIKKKLTEQEVKLKKEVTILRKRLYRRDEKLKSMSNIIDTLKTHNTCNSDLEQILRNMFNDQKLEVILKEYNLSAIIFQHKDDTHKK